MRLSKYVIFTLIFAKGFCYSEYSMFLEIALDLQDAFAFRSALFVLDTNNGNYCK
jgi:hypothetical protein